MITTKAILVNPSISSWSGQRQDRKVSEEIEDAKGAKHGSGVYRKYLIDPNAPALKKIRDIDSQMRAYHYGITLPWGDDGARLLASVAYMEYMEKMGSYRNLRETAVRDFISQYPAHKEIAKQRLNGLYNEDDYPTPETLEEKFSVRIKVNPVPDGNDLRVDIGADEKAKIRAQIEEETNRAISDAVMHVLGRMKKCVDDMMGRLSSYSVNDKGKPEHTFRDSVVGNMRELLDIIPKLNVTNDPRITEMAQRIGDSLLGNSPAELRDNYFVRSETISKADELSKALESMGVQ